MIIEKCHVLSYHRVLHADLAAVQWQHMPRQLRMPVARGSACNRGCGRKQYMWLMPGDEASNNILPLQYNIGENRRN
jgi:hypothetical protein